MTSGMTKRLATIEILVQGSSAASHPANGMLVSEHRMLADSARVSSPRRELLQVLHTARLLEAFLGSIVAQHQIPIPEKKKSLGGYLTVLKTHTRITIANLPEGRRSLHQKYVVDVRNHFLHNAGVVPTKKQADELLSSMHTCLADVAGLE